MAFFPTEECKQTLELPPILLQTIMMMWMMLRCAVGDEVEQWATLYVVTLRRSSSAVLLCDLVRYFFCALQSQQYPNMWHDNGNLYIRQPRNRLWGAERKYKRRAPPQKSERCSSSNESCRVGLKALVYFLFMLGTKLGGL